VALIARAAEGSVRDSLSLLDQAIAHAAGPVRAEDVRQMLGLADRARTIDLFQALMGGDIAAALKELRDQYDTGADPAVVLADIAEFTNFVTRVKVVPAVADDVAFSEVERKRGRDFAARLSMRVLSRTWQMLLKGLAEVQSAGRPIAAAEMVLVRIAYAADLPTPDEAIRALNGGAASPGAQPSGNGGATAPAATSGNAPVQRIDAPRGAPRAALAPREAAQPTPAEIAAKPVLALNRFEDLIALAASQRDLTVKTALERDVRLVRFEDGKLELALEPGAAKSLVHDLSRKLGQWTGRRWMVVVSTEAGAPTVRSQADARQAEFERGVAADPFVQEVLARFPGAQIVDVRRNEPGMMPADALPPAGDDDGEPPEPMFDDDGSAFGAHGLPDDVDDDF
jgi:DNA polymerase-3 subunit gamma/tau